VREALARADEALPAPVVAAAASLEWPVEPVRITSAFGVREDPLGAGARPHTGVDLAALEGQLVRTSGPGTVLFAARRGGYGLHVEVRHEGDLVTRYAHLSSIDVRAGDRLEAGAVLGRAGRTGRATGPHLHFELWRDGLPVDPGQELPAVPRRLSTRD
jgi:murein DD-endopeptidase MepM/ murein hydrolase activator NlpD